jgi:hypothetical protein
MKKMLFSLLVVVMAVMLIGACPVPGCQYVNDCSTWHLTGVSKTDAGPVHIVGSATVGDTATAAKSGRLMIVLDGTIGCVTCGVDDTTYTGTLVEDVTLGVGTTPIDIVLPVIYNVPHTVTLYLGQTDCANCAQTLVIKTDVYVPPTPPTPPTGSVSIATECPQPEFVNDVGETEQDFNWTISVVTNTNDYNIDYSTDGINWSGPIDWSDQNDPIAGGGFSGPMTTVTDSAWGVDGSHLWVRLSNNPSVSTDMIAQCPVTPVVTPKPIPQAFAQLWVCTDGSNCFNYNITPGPDAQCLLFDYSKVSTYSSIPALCVVDPAYTGGFTLKSQKMIPLPYGTWLSYQMFYRGH